MASKRETNVVYSAGIVQGIVLVIGINAEGKSLEDITQPLTSTDEPASPEAPPVTSPA